MTSTDFNPFAGGELLRVSPATAPQKEVIASAQISDEANTAFNEAVSITMKGDLNLDLLKSCFLRVIVRHDILRATFSRNGNEICLHETIPFDLDFEDLRGQGAQEQKKIISDLWRNIAISPMNLEEGPLFFAWVKQLEDTGFELIIAAHHIVCDGWTFGLFLNELTSLYRNQGSDENLPAAESFFDFAEQIDAKEISNTDNDYWLDKFKQIPPVLDLPLDMARPPARTFKAQRFDYNLNSELISLLPAAAAKLKASLVNVVLASYFVLLHRLTASEDIVVGLPVAGQAAMNRLQQAGHMVQLLPIRLAVTSETIFSDLVDQVKREVLNASEHPNFTFGKLLKTIKVDRSRVPLVSTIFNIDQPMHSLDFGDVQGTLRTVPRAAENFEIFLNILPSSESLTIEATYSTALFSEPTILSWLQSLETIISEAISEPEKKIGHLALAHALPDILLQSNATDIDIKYPDLISAFKTQAQKTPDKKAVICSDLTLTYQVLDQHSDAIASVLAQKGIKENDVIGICCERSEQMLASILAIYKLGAAYLPLDPDFPQDRLTYMLEDSGAVAVIEDEAAPKGVRDATVAHFEIGSFADLTIPENTIPLPTEDPERLAYIIYTSGSTGKPKGVRVQNRAMINFLESMAREPGCNDADRLLAVTTLSFDISVLELYMPLICGATTVIATREEAKDGEKLAELIEKNSITQLQATPSTWRMLLASKWQEQRSSSRLKALCGGEALPPDLAKDLLPQVAELWNMFGPTETTVWSTCKRISDADMLITIGTPIANTQVYILDKNLKLLPLSAPGELFIGGEGVTLGYHNRPDLNAKSFLHHPVFGRIYSTGDLAKLLPNGEIQHLGRLDDQVKLRGYRIELGEIESALINCADVDAAAVYLWELSPDDVRIVACCVPTSVGNFASIAIRKRLREILPSYMIPQYLLEIPEIPLTPNGKIDRKSLPRPEVRESTILTTSALISDTEKLVAKIWTELIKPKNSIGREDNFFDLGGHSLLALQAIRKIENATGKHISPAEIVSEQLASIAEKIEEETTRNDNVQTGPTALSSTTIRGLSLEQRRILNRQLKHPESVCNNLPAAWLLEGDLDLTAFSKSLERVYEKQTALRTLIQAYEGDYRQIIQHVSNIILPEFEDCSTAETPLDDALDKANQLATQPFVPLNNLLCRSKLYKLGAQKHLFVFIPHQLIFDGWSFDIFLGELDAAYQTFSEGRSLSTSSLPFEFRDYAHWSRTRNIDSEQRDYHLPAVKKISTVNFLKDAQTKGTCERREYSFSADDLAGIEAFCEKHKLRLHELLFAAFTKSLCDLLKDQSVVLGVPVTGRYSPDSIGLIGNFLSTLPCEVRIDGNHFVTITKSISQQLHEFYDHQDVSYAEITNGTERENQLFPNYMSASVGFQDIRNRPRSLGSLGLSQIDMTRKQTEVPIEFWSRIQPDSFLLVFDYDNGLVENDTINSLAASIKQLLKNIENLQEEPDTTATNTDQQPTEKKPLWRRLFQ